MRGCDWRINLRELIPIVQESVTGSEYTRRKVVYGERTKALGSHLKKSNPRATWGAYSPVGTTSAQRQRSLHLTGMQMKAEESVIQLSARLVALR